MAEELTLPATLPPLITEFLSKQTYESGICIRSVNNLADTMAKHLNIITDEWFADLLVTQEITEISKLPGIYKIRNAVTAATKGETPIVPPSGPAAPASAAVIDVTPVATTLTSTLGDGFGSSAPVGAPVAKKLSAAGNNPVMSSTVAAESKAPTVEAVTPVVETTIVAPEVDPIDDTLPWDESVPVVIDIEAEVVVDPGMIITPTPTLGGTVTVSPVETDDAPRTRAKGKIVSGGPENIIKELLARIDDRDEEIAKLKKALTEASSSQMKLTAASVKRLTELGITVD